MLKTIETGINGLILVKPDVFVDPRGHFLESYNIFRMKEIGIDVQFVQDNQSLSGKGIVRGLHFQKPPHAQDKLVRVIKGAVLDVVVDIRKDSSTYGKTFSVELNEDNFLMLFIPKGFAHGFATLSDNTIFCYKCSDVYHPETEGGLLWSDPTLNIDWKVGEPLLSDKDNKYPTFTELNSPF